MQNMESQVLPPLLNPRTTPTPPPPPFFFFFCFLKNLLRLKINILSSIYPEINFPAEPVMKINNLSRPKVPGPPSESNGRPLTFSLWIISWVKLKYFLKTVIWEFRLQTTLLVPVYIGKFYQTHILATCVLRLWWCDIGSCHVAYSLFMDKKCERCRPNPSRLDTNVGNVTLTFDDLEHNLGSWTAIVLSIFQILETIEQS